MSSIRCTSAVGAIVSRHNEDFCTDLSTSCPVHRRAASASGWRASSCSWQGSLLSGGATDAYPSEQDMIDVLSQ